MLEKGARSRVSRATRSRHPHGFSLLRSYVPPDQQREILEWIEANVTWRLPSPEGYRMEHWLVGRDAIPRWAEALADRVLEDGIFDESPLVVLLSRYLRGEGVAPHRDHQFLGEIVVGLTLGSTRVFELTRRGRRPVRVLLAPGDLYVLEGTARWLWHHGIPWVETDEFDGQLVERSECVSITWRRPDNDVIALARPMTTRHPSPFVLRWLRSRFRRVFS